jgi:hypothetical protein
MKTLPRPVRVGFNAVLLCMSAWFTVSIAIRVQRGIASAHWPSAPLSSFDDRSETIQYLYMGHLGNQSGVQTVPAVTYSFEVNGTTYRGNTQSYLGEGPDGRFNLHARFNGGMEKKLVYYKPDDPTINVLFPGAAPGKLLQWLVLGLFSTITASFAVRGLARLLRHVG